MLRIALLDDHPIVRAGFRRLLDAEPGWQIVAELGSVAQLAEWLLHASCDVLVLDLSLPDGDGLMLTRKLRAKYPDMRLIVLSMHEGALYVKDALAAGCNGYVSKRSGPDELIAAITTAVQGDIYLSSDLRHLAPQDEGGDKLPELTERESQVFLLLARGHSVARIASALGLSAKTVYIHRSNAMQKLGLATDHDVHLLAQRRGL